LCAFDGESEKNTTLAREPMQLLQSATTLTSGQPKFSGRPD
jgi:hypothetical protein